MEDRRRVHRIDFELPLTFKVGDPQQNLSIATTVNISAVGLCFVTKEELQKGQQLPIQIQLPNQGKVVISTKVVWVKEKGILRDKEYAIGVEIIEPMKKEEAKFIKFFAKELSSQYKKDTN